MDEPKETDRKRRAKPVKNYTCPTCGNPNALTEYERRKGYHCANCTRRAEYGMGY